MIDVAITPPATEASYFHPVEIGTVEFMRTVKRDSPTGALFYSRSGARHTGDFGSRSSARYGRPYEGSRRVVTYDSEVTGKSFDNASVDNRRDRRRAYEEREPRGRRVVPY
ncbi:hypothetical protein FGIG_12058 [Fasciola gigantica]|nr:hypothetical protein FGIG_12058 [Fasciola gigantica]